jgi:hypothetical protein
MHRLVTALRRGLDILARRRGQGTVEYVGIVLAIGALLLALAGPLNGMAKPVATKVANAITQAIDDTLDGGKGDGTK